jgi:putative aminopeptidase FrvX
MNELPPLDSKYLQELLLELLNTPSPTGFTDRVVDLMAEKLSRFDQLQVRKTVKGALLAEWIRGDQPARRGLTAHLDTLGAMVKEIKCNGRLKLTQLGSYPWPTIEGEGCSVLTSGGETIRGAVLIDHASAHVHGKKTAETERNQDHLEVRLDLRSSSPEETREAGIEVGDFVFFDPRVEVSRGFIRSRHLDDKAGAACLAAAVQALTTAGLAPAVSSAFHFSNYEEVGHGAAAGLPDSLEELIAVDMAAVGEGQNSDEFHATLCLKDSRGPYHRRLNTRLKQLAEEHHIAHRLDIYPYYGSDGEAYWRAGGDVAVALIGPGVDASHNYERTHLEALTATTRWIMAYLLSDVR